MSRPRRPFNQDSCTRKPRPPRLLGTTPRKEVVPTDNPLLQLLQQELQIPLRIEAVPKTLPVPTPSKKSGKLLPTTKSKEVGGEVAAEEAITNLQVDQDGIVNGSSSPPNDPLSGLDQTNSHPEDMIEEIENDDEETPTKDDEPSDEESDVPAPPSPGNQLSDPTLLKDYEVMEESDYEDSIGENDISLSIRTSAEEEDSEQESDNLTAAEEEEGSERSDPSSLPESQMIEDPAIPILVGNTKSVRGRKQSTPKKKSLPSSISQDPKTPHVSRREQPDRNREKEVTTSFSGIHPPSNSDFKSKSKQKGSKTTGEKTKKQSTDQHRKPRRHFKTDTILLRKIRREQQNAHKTHVLKTRPLRDLIRECCAKVTSNPIRIQKKAFDAIREGCEDYITRYFEAAVVVMTGAQNKILLARHMKTLRDLRTRGLC